MNCTCRPCSTTEAASMQQSVTRKQTHSTLPRQLVPRGVAGAVDSLVQRASSTKAVPATHAARTTAIAAMATMSMDLGVVRCASPRDTTHMTSIGRATTIPNHSAPNRRASDGGCDQLCCSSNSLPSDLAMAPVAA